jgi:PTH2 family peptidyl-tRNA hydrolase
MTAGKAASQAGHAFVESFAKADPQIAESYVAADGGTKIVLSAPDLQSLLKVHGAAFDAGIPCAVIIESGHVMPPVFDGSPVITAVGIGPVERAKARAFTKQLRLLQ